MDAIIVNSGLDLVSAVLGGDTTGYSGTSTGTTATTLTDTGAAWTTNAYAGHVVVTGSVYGVVASNTATALTIDKWYTPASPGGAAAATPATGAYVVLPGGQPAFWMALTANSTAPASTDTTLAGEITTAGGGLVRAVATYAHTSGASTFTLTKTYTANGSDALPVTIAKVGTFNSSTGGRMVQETLLSSTAPLSASGDALTITDTLTV